MKLLKIVLSITHFVKCLDSFVFFAYLESTYTIWTSGQWVNVNFICWSSMQKYIATDTLIALLLCFHIGLK